MSRRLVLLGLVLCTLAGAVSAQLTSMTEGYSLQLNGGLQQLGGLDDLDGQISGMNHYFGEYGEFVSDAQRGVNTGDWAPYLNMGKIKTWDHLGIRLQKELIRWEYSAFSVGLRYADGANQTSSLFHYTVPNQVSLEGRIWGSEWVQATNTMLSCSYKLRDRVMPLWIKAELGLGMASLQTEGTYRFSSPNLVLPEDDPGYSQMDITQELFAEYEGDAFCADFCLGVEYRLGSIGLQLDLGYNYMNFGELDEGSTTYRAVGDGGAIVEYEVINVPDARYEFVPVIRASLTHMVDLQLNLGEPLPGYPEGLDAGTIDVDYYTSERLGIDAPQTIEYDLSGPYAKLGLAWYF